MKGVTLLALLLPALFVSGCGNDPDQQANDSSSKPMPVSTAPVETAPVRQRVRTVGVLAPRDEIRLSFKTGGVIDRIDVEAGDRVKQGQVLAVLKSAEVDAAVARAREAARNAELDLKRARKLRKDEVVTDELVEDLTTAYNVAQANLRSARFNERFSRIEAPVDGVVLERLAESDELVQGGQPVLLLGATEKGWVVRSSLADRDIVRVSVGDSADLRFDAFPGRVFPGSVSRVGSSADRQTGTFEIEIDVESDGARFVRGLVARVELSLDEANRNESQTVVPLTAIVEADGTDAFVYMFDAEQSIARRREVTVGAIVGDRVVIVTGLEPGQEVITDGAAWLIDGNAVEVVADRG
jgi:RND family efflux transporter MFP subunit